MPTAVNTGENAGESFCVLFGTYQPFDEAKIDELYPTRGGYLARVIFSDLRNIGAGYLLPADARTNLREALGSDVGR